MTEPSLNDLDRCVHGRHSIDNCNSCPALWSEGNLFLTNGQRIGTTYAGEPIYAQTRRDLRSGTPHPMSTDPDGSDAEFTKRTHASWKPAVEMATLDASADEREERFRQERLGTWPTDGQPT